MDGRDAGTPTGISPHPSPEDPSLRESEARLSMALEVTNAGIWEWCTADNSVHFDERFHAMLGYAQGELPSKLDDWQSYHHPDDLPGVLLRAKAYMDGSTPTYASEHRLRARNGDWRWVSTNGKLVQAAQGGGPEYFFGVATDVTKRREAEEALRESEAKVRRKLKAIAEPEGDLADLSLADIVDCDTLQTIMEGFHRLTRIAMAVLDVSGMVLVAVGWQDICTKFHRVHPQTCRNCHESDTALTEGVATGQFRAYRCKNGMWDVVTPVVVGERHIGNIFIGQFFYDNDVVDREWFRTQARQYGFDEEQYLAALDRVPVWPRETIDTAMAFFSQFAAMLSSLSYGTIKLSRTIAQKDAVLGQLEESENRYRQLFESASDALFAIDADTGQIVEANGMALELYGYSREELLAMNRAELSAPPEKTAAPPVAEKVSTPFHRRKDGTAFPVEITARAFTLRDRPVLLVAVRDVTERRRAEEAIRESRATLNLVLDTVPQSVFWKGLDGRYLGCNRVFAVAAGLADPSEIIGKTDFDLPWPRAEAEAYRLDDREVIDKNAPKSHIIEQLQQADGTRLWVDTSKVPLRDANGSPIAVLGVYEDITDRRQAEEERARLETQLQQAQKMESVGRLAGGVAHDFNNMLQVVLNEAALGRTYVSESDPLYTTFSEIIRASERSADLTRQLLAFARRQTVTPRVLNLNEVVEGMLKMLRRLIGENIDLLWKPGSDLWSVTMDPSQIDQILANLCVNARDAIAGVGKLTIETANCSFDTEYCALHVDSLPGDYVRLAVSDTGCGMDKEILTHVFEPFFTTKGLGEGTGLGLATVYGIVKQSRGFINLYSEPNLGTTFSIYLPRHADAGEALPEGETLWPDLTGKETILLVEDERAILKLTTMMLAAQGYIVLPANTPADAIRIARERTEPIDLLMTDVIMPQMNGKDLAKSIESLHPELKTLFMSGYTADVIAHHGVLEEGIHFVQKPFSIQDMAIRVRAALEGKQPGSHLP